MSTITNDIQKAKEQLVKLEQLAQLEKEQQAKIESERLAMDEAHQEKLKAQQQLEETTEQLKTQIIQLLDKTEYMTKWQALQDQMDELNKVQNQREYQIYPLMRQLYNLWTNPVYEDSKKVGVELNGKINNKLAELLQLPGQIIAHYLK